MNHDEITPKAVACSYIDAAVALATEDPAQYECCGAPLTRFGTCQFRSHPTPMHSEILSYPEHYDYEGRFLP